MSKKRARNQKARKTAVITRSKAVVILITIAALTLTGVLMAQHNSLKALINPTASPAATPQSQPTLSKEYVYAGGRLIATEEPGGGAPGCSFSISPSSQNFPASGGAGTFNVSTQSGCNWTAISNAGFITITSNPMGSGIGAVNFSVANNTGAARNGTITVEGQTFTVTQSGTSGCTYSISPSSLTISSSAGSGSVSLTTQSGCAWTVVNNNPEWITLTSPTSGTGSASVTYSVTQNTSSSSRTGTINIAGQLFSLTQLSSCSYSISPTSQTAPQSGISSASFSVNAVAGCSWSAATSDSWITVNTQTGTGSGQVFYSVASNPGPQRTGSIIVSAPDFAQHFTITQASASNNSSFVTQNVPSAMAPTAGQSVTVTMTNNGSTTWTPGNYVLRSQNPSGNTTWGMSEVPLPATVASGAQVTFTFTITAPVSEGVYDCQWQMSTAGGTYFGAMTPNVAITVSSATPPPGPTNLTATKSGTNITLNWQNNVASNYIQIERKIGSGNWGLRATVGSTTTSFVDPSLPSGTYTYRVRCFVGNGTASTYSNEASQTIGGTAPLAPSDMIATLGSGLQVNLNWTDNSTNETEFKIERRTGSGSYMPLDTVGVNVTSHLDTTVQPNTQYTYRVKAVNGTLESGYSNESSVTTGPPPPPSAPSDLNATVISCTRVDLTWLDNSNNETGFKVERRTGTGAFSVIATLGAGTTSYSDLTAAASTEYTYQVRAYSNAGGDSAPSNQRTVTTPAPPTAPTGLSATAQSSSQINLSWTDTSTTEQGFKIERKTGAGSFSEIGMVNANVTSFSDSGLSASTAYTYQVRAYSGTVFSAYSNQATATTQASGGPPCPTVSTLSGSGTYGYAEANGTSAHWRKPVAGVVAKHPLTGQHALFIADTENHRIRMVYLEGASTGQSSLIAGSGIAGYSDGNGWPPDARFNNPRGIAAVVNAQGTVTSLIVADTGNHVIRKLAWGGNGNWELSLLSGATPGSAGNQDGDPATAMFNSPEGIVVAPNGFIYVTDSGNGMIRSVTQTGSATTLTGGPNVGMSSPAGITSSSNSTLYVSDSSTHKIYQVTSGGSVSVIAGSGAAGFADGTGAGAIFNSPSQLVWANPTGGAVLFIADRNNNRIRRLALATNAVNTHAGNGTAGFANGSCSVAQFNGPRGVAYFGSGSALYILDSNNNRIRKAQ